MVNASDYPWLLGMRILLALMCFGTVALVLSDPQPVPWWYVITMVATFFAGIGWSVAAIAAAAHLFAGRVEEGITKIEQIKSRAGFEEFEEAYEEELEDLLEYEEEKTRDVALALNARIHPDSQ